jgi:hypothetical protein
VVRKNEHTCRWRVDFRELAYDGGGSASWTQFYFTKVGALLSKFRNLHITSWGGKADLIDLCGDDPVPPPIGLEEVTMGIRNIEVLAMDDTSLHIRQVQAALQEQRIGEHNRGEHTWGNMRRDCPLCHAGK